MSKRLCALLKIQSPSIYRTLAILSLVAGIVLSFFCLPTIAHAEEIITKVIVNYEDKGDFFLIATEDGDFLVKKDELEKMGFKKDVPAKVVTLDGEQYVSLMSIDGVGFSFDEEEVSLFIMATPELLKEQVLDLYRQRSTKVFMPDHPSGFLNYGLVYTDEFEKDFESFTLTNQLGIRRWGWLFLTDTSYTKDDTKEEFTRLSTSLTHDRREDMTRLVLGDFIASSGGLGGSVMLGGVRFSKVFQINPYFIKQPKLNIRGFLTTPSEVEVYMDDVLIRKERLSPGEFELRNIFQTLGARTVEVIIRDAFGVERRLRYPYYFTETVLGKGIHEYSYALGYRRENFGTESFSYGDLALTGFHRYGLSDFLTAGVSLEATEGLVNAGVEASRVFTTMGVMTLRARASNSDGRYGEAGSFNYSYIGGNRGLILSLAMYSEDYENITSIDGVTSRVKYEFGSGVNYGREAGDYISLNLNAIKNYDGSRRRELSLRYSKPLGRYFILYTRLRRIETDYNENEFFVGLHYYPRNDLFASASYTRGRSSESERFQLQKIAPTGVGYGYRMLVEKQKDTDSSSTKVEPAFQYNASHGIYRIEYTDVESTGQDISSLRASFSGSILAVGGKVGLSRPVYDSFGLVKVDSLEGVKVYVNNQEIGETDSKGYLFIPTIGSYHHSQLSIRAKDIPIDYYVPEAIKYVSPPLRGGFCMDFNVRRVQVLTGRLFVEMDGTVQPVEYESLTMKFDGGEATFETGSDGEFYMDNFQLQEEDSPVEDPARCVFLEEKDAFMIKPGTHRAKVELADGECDVEFTVPEATGDIFAELGDVVCKNVRWKKKELPEELETIEPEPTQPDVAPPPAPALTLHFDFDDYTVRPAELEKLRDFVKEIDLKTVEKIELNGYTCDIGTKAYNDRLALNRALSVKKALEGLGIPASLITVSGEGKCCYVSKKRPLNRRVEIRVIRKPPPAPRVPRPAEREV